MLMLKYYYLPLLLILPMVAQAAEQTNPYMSRIKTNSKTCVSQNISDCQKSICIASPESCKEQCRANAVHKCQQLSGQHIDGYSSY